MSQPGLDRAQGTPTPPASPPASPRARLMGALHAAGAGSSSRDGLDVILQMELDPDEWSLPQHLWPTVIVSTPTDRMWRQPLDLSRTLPPPRRRQRRAPRTHSAPAALPAAAVAEVSRAGAASPQSCPPASPWPPRAAAMIEMSTSRQNLYPALSPPPPPPPEASGLCGRILVALSWLLVVITMPFSFFISFKVVQEYERAVIFRLGRLQSGGARGPGIFFILPCIDTYARVDLRTVTYDIPPQEVLTKDSVTVSVDAVVYYRVQNATVSITNVENAHAATRLLAQTTLRNTIGKRPLHEILSERETISGSMQQVLDEATELWGIKVERVEIKDVRLPVQLQRAMAAEAEAAREARAKVIAAEGELKASRALREASEVIGDSPAALQLRYLQTLNTISAEKNSTIIFPLPIDLVTYFMRAHENRE